MDDEVKNELTKLLRTIHGVGTRVEPLESYAKRAETRLESLEAHAKRVDTRLESLEAHAKATNVRLAHIERKLESHDKRFDRIDERFDRMDERFDEVLAEIRVITAGFVRHDDRLGDLEKRVTRLELRRA